VTKEYAIFVLTLHPIHKLRPLDCTVFGPYKIYYNAYVSDWMLSNLGRPVIIYSVEGIIGNSFSKAFTKQNIEKRVSCERIRPLNGNIFDAD